MDLCKTEDIVPEGSFVFMTTDLNVAHAINLIAGMQVDAGTDGKSGLAGASGPSSAKKRRRFLSTDRRSCCKRHVASSQTLISTSSAWTHNSRASQSAVISGRRALRMPARTNAPSRALQARRQTMQCPRPNAPAPLLCAPVALRGATCSSSSAAQKLPVGFRMPSASFSSTWTSRALVT